MDTPDTRAVRLVRTGAQMTVGSRVTRLSGPCPASGDERPESAESGFVLLESIISITLLAVIMAALTTFSITVTSSTNYQRQRQAAVQIANSTMEQIRGRAPSEVYLGRAATDVAAQFAAAPDAVKPYLQAADTTPATDSTRTTDVMDPVETTVVNNTTFTSGNYLGWCGVPKGTTTNATCTAMAAADANRVRYLRAVVGVTWAGKNCPANQCNYVTSTLVNTDVDPTFALDQAGPTAPVVHNPGNQVSYQSIPLSQSPNQTLQLALEPGNGTDPATWQVDQLPPGLTMSTSGLVTGTPTTVGTTTVTVTVTDAFLETATRTFTWTVNPAVTSLSGLTNPFTTTAGATIAPQTLNWICPGGGCSYTLSGAPAGIGLSQTAGSGSAASLSPTGTNGTFYLRGATTAAAAPTSTAYAADVAAMGASNFWRLGERSGTLGKDSIGTSDLTHQSGVTPGTPGAVVTNADAAAAYDGTTSGTSSTSTLIGGPQTFTQSLWFKTTTTVGGRMFGFSSNQTGVSGGYDRQFWLGDDGKLYYSVYNGSALTDTEIVSSASYNDGKWHQAVATLSSGTGMKLYVDGAQIGAKPGATSAQGFSGYWRVGGDNLDTWPGKPTSRYFAGAIDDISVYPTVLTAAQVAQQYADATPARYSVSVTPKTSGGATGSVATAAWTVNPPPSAAGMTTPVATARGAVIANQALTYSCPSGSCTFGLAGAPAGIGLSTATTGALGASVTVATTSGTIYLRGTVDNAATGTYTATLTPTDVSTSVVGATTNATWTIAGPPAVTGLTNPFTTTAGAAIAAQTLPFTCGTGSCTYAVTGAPAGIGVATTAGGTGAASTTAPGTSGNVYLVGTSAAASAPGPNAYPSDVTGASPSSYWRLGERSGTTAAATTGSVGLTHQSGVTVGVPGALASSADAGAAFDGTANGNSATTAAVTAPQVFSLSLWFRTTSTTGGTLMEMGSVPTGPAPTHDRMIYLDNAGHVTFGVYPSAYKTVTSTGTYNDGAWHQAVATLSGAGQVLYVDGALAASGTNTAAQNYATGYWRLGLSRTDSWPNFGSNDRYPGSLDEVAVYPTALSAAQVAQQYADARAASYTVAVGSTEPNGTVGTGTTSAWTVNPPPSAGGMPAVATTGGATVARRALTYSCPSGACTLALTGAPSGIGIAANTTDTPTASLTVSATSGTVYVGGTVSSGATTGAYTVVLTPTDTTTSVTGLASSATWTVNGTAVVSGVTALTTARGATIPSQALTYSCPSGSCSIALTGAPSGIGLNLTDSGTPATSVSVTATSGTIYLRGTVSAGATTGSYTPTVTPTDTPTGTVGAGSSATWTVNAVPTVTGVTALTTTRGATIPSQALTYTCPSSSCSIAVNSAPTGIGLNTTDSGTPATSVNVTGTSGTVYLRGTVSAAATTGTYTPTVTPTDTVSGVAGTASSATWTVNAGPTVTGLSGNYRGTRNQGAIFGPLPYTCPSGSCTIAVTSGAAAGLGMSLTSTGGTIANSVAVTATSGNVWLRGNLTGALGSYTIAVTPTDTTTGVVGTGGSISMLIDQPTVSGLNAVTTTPGATITSQAISYTCPSANCTIGVSGAPTGIGLNTTDSGTPAASVAVAATSGTVYLRGTVTGATGSYTVVLTPVDAGPSTPGPTISATWTVNGPPSVTGVTALTTTRGATIPSQALTYSCPSGACTIAVSGAPAGTGLNTTDSGTPAGSVSVTSTSGTVYLRGTVTGAAGTYTPTVTPTDTTTGTVGTASSATWTVRNAPAVTGVTALTTTRGATIPSQALTYTCPSGACTIALTSGPTGVGLNLTDSGTPAASVNVTATSGTVYLRGTVSSSATPGTYTPTVTPTDTTTSAVGTASSASWTIRAGPVVTGVTAVTTTRGATVPSQALTYTCPSGACSITVVGVPAGAGLNLTDSGTPTGTVNVSATSGTIYLRGTVTGAAGTYTVTVTPTDTTTSVAGTASSATWTVNDVPTVSGLTNPFTTTAGATIANQTLPWTCPAGSCTETLAGAPSGIGLATTAGGTPTSPVSVSGTSGNVFLRGTVAAGAAPNAAAYPGDVTAAGASSYWRLGERSGTSATDSAGSNPLVHRSGVTTGVPGALSTSADAAISLDGVSGLSSTTSTVTPPTVFSISLWFRTTTTTGGGLAELNEAATGSIGSHDRIVYMDDAGHLSFGVYPTTYKTVTSTGTYNDGAWHQAVATLSGGGQSLYVDGARVAYDTNTAAQSNYASGYWRLGVANRDSWPSSGTSAFWAGSIDEFAVFPTALSAAQVAQQYADARPTGYAVSVTPADANVAGTPNTAAWTVNPVPSAGGVSALTTTRGATVPSQALTYSCPSGSCTLALTGAPAGVGLNATDSGTPNASLAVTGTSGTVYLRGTVTGTAGTYTPTVTPTDTPTGVSGNASSATWTVRAAPSVTGVTALTTTRGATIPSQALTYSCPSGSCSISVVGVPSGTGLNPTDSGTPTGTVNVTGTSGTVYLRGTITGAAGTYTPTVTPNDTTTGAAGTASSATWVVNAVPTVTGVTALTTTRGATVSQTLTYSCPSANCSIALTGAPAGVGLSAAASGGTPGTPLTVAATSGTIYLRGTITGAAGTYSPTVTPTDTPTSVVGTASSATWTVNAGPTVTGVTALTTTRGATITSQALTYTCPSANCSIALTGAPTGIGLNTADSGTPATSVNVTATSGTVYLRGTVSAAATTGTYTPTVTPTDTPTGVTGVASSATWTVNAGPTVTGLSGNYRGTRNQGAIFGPLPYTCPSGSCTIAVTSGAAAGLGMSLTSTGGTIANSVAVTATSGNVWLRGNLTGALGSYTIAVTPTDTTTGVVGTGGSISMLIDQPTVSGLNAVTATQGATITSQVISYTCPSANCTIGVSGAPTGIGLNTTDSGTPAASVAVAATSGTVYLRGTITGAAGTYTVVLTPTDAGPGTPGPTISATWTVRAAPTIDGLTDPFTTTAGATIANQTLPYTCPTATCTYALSGAPSGIGLATTTTGTTSGSQTVSGPSGNLYLRGTVASSAAPSSTAYTSDVSSMGATNFWRLGERSGTTGADGIGTNNLVHQTGVTVGQPGALATNADAAAGYSGTTTGSSATVNSFSGPQTFSQSLWFKTTTTSGGRLFGFSTNQTGTSGGYDRMFWMDNSGKLNYAVNPGGDSQLVQQTITTSAAYNDGQWHQVVATVSTSTGNYLYVDGVQVGAHPTIKGAQPLTGYWRLGGDNVANWPNQPSSYYFAGSLDEVAIYPTALSDVQIAQQYRDATNAGYSLSIVPTDSSGVAGLADTAAWTVAPPPSVAGQTTPFATTRGATITSQPLTYSCPTGSCSFAVSGAPSGIGLDNDDSGTPAASVTVAAGSGTIYLRGTVSTSATLGAATVTITPTDLVANYAGTPATAAWTVYAQPTVTGVTAVTTTQTLAVANQTLTYTCPRAACTYTVSGAPNGVGLSTATTGAVSNTVSVSATSGSIYLRGTPTASGTFTVSVAGTDTGSGVVGPASSATWTIRPLPNVTGPSGGYSFVSGTSITGTFTANCPTANCTVTISGQPTGMGLALTSGASSFTSSVSITSTAATPVYLKGSVGTTLKTYVIVLTPTGTDGGTAITGNADTFTISVTSGACTYASTVTADAPTTYYRFGEASGTTAVDNGSTGSAQYNSGRYEGSPTLNQTGAITCDSSTAALFNGSNTSITTSAPAVTSPLVFSIEAWFKTSTGGGKLVGFGNVSSGASTSYDRQLYLTNTGQIAFGVYTSTPVALVTSGTYINNAYHHVVGVQSATGMSLYVDGALVASNSAVPTAAGQYQGYWRVGYDAVTSWPSAPTNPYFTGTLDEVAVYNTALTAARVSAHYAARQ